MISMAMLGTQAIAAYALVVVLARLLGADGLGIYAYAMSILMLLVMPAKMGIPQLLVREVAKSCANRDPKHLRAVYRWGNAAVIRASLFSLILLCVVYFLANSYPKKIPALDPWVLLCGGMLIPLIALSDARAATIRGLGFVLRGQISATFLRPCLFIGFITALQFILQDTWSPRPDIMMLLHAVAALVTLSVSAAILAMHLPSVHSESNLTSQDRASLWQAVVPLALISGLMLINRHMDLVILGAFRSQAEVGIYRAVFETSLLIIFALKAVNPLLQPRFASLYARGQLRQVKVLFIRSSWLMFACAALPALFFIVFGSQLLGTLFGAEFVLGNAAMRILVIGQVINAGFGPVGVLLNMTGHERDALIAVLIAAISNVILNVLLVPSFGVEGAAIATVSTLLLWNLRMRLVIRKKLKI